MRKKIILFVSMAAGVFACTQLATKSDPGKRYFCNSGGGDSLCRTLPNYVEEVFVLGYSSTSINFVNPTPKDSAEQTPLDLFSWQTFVALNWPSDESGKPTGNIMDNDLKSQRVWEHFQDPQQVFGDPQAPLSLHLSMSKQASAKFFYMFSKSPHRLMDSASNDVTEADGFPLIDKYGNFTLYEIKMNPTEVTFVTSNKLTSYEGIYNYNNHAGFTLPYADSSNGGVPGFLEIKASWRIMSPADDASTFYCRTADIYIDSLHTVDKKPLVIHNVKVGMVGMHIISNTLNMNSPNLIWSSFEHINNAPDSADTAKTTNWSYYNRACSTCEINKHVPRENNYIWDTVQPYAKKYTTNGYGTQVIRVNKIFRYTDTVNVHFRAKLKNTVWANYFLVGTQWENADGPPNKITAAPPSLSNTTMETFIQKNSCIGCHQGANIIYQNDTMPTGMSFIFPVTIAAPPAAIKSANNKKK